MARIWVRSGLSYSDNYTDSSVGGSTLTVNVTYKMLHVHAYTKGTLKHSHASGIPCPTEHTRRCTGVQQQPPKRMEWDDKMISILALCSVRVCIDAAITCRHIQIIRQDIESATKKADKQCWVVHCGIIPPVDLLWAVITVACAATSVHYQPTSAITTHVLLICVAASCAVNTTTLAAQFHFYAARHPWMYYADGLKWRLDNLMGYPGIKTTSCASQCACLYTLQNRFVQLSWVWWALLVAVWATHILALFMQYTHGPNDTDDELPGETFTVAFAMVFGTSVFAAFATVFMTVLFRLGCRPCGEKARSNFIGEPVAHIEGNARPASVSPADIYGESVPTEQAEPWYSARKISTACLPTTEEANSWTIKIVHAAVVATGSTTTIVFSWYMLWFTLNTDLHDGAHTPTETAIPEPVLSATVAACVGNTLASAFILLYTKNSLDSLNTKAKGQSSVNRISTSIRTGIERTRTGIVERTRTRR